MRIALERFLHQQGERVHAVTHIGVQISGTSSNSATRWPMPFRCRRDLGWNSIWRNLQRHEVIVSGSDVNRLIDGWRNERLPAIDFTHVDLPGSEQRPEQHGRSFCRWEHGLRFDPTLELLV